MSSILNIFSEKFDQAHLVAILISAIVAIFVVLLNQWFLARRAKRELLINKIEEVFSASNDYVSACRELFDSMSQQNIDRPGDYYEYPQDSVNKLNDSITRMQMICGLYFRSEAFEPDDFYIWNMPILEMAHKGTTPPEAEGYSIYKQSKAHISRSRERLNNLCKKLMKKYGH